MQDERNQQAFKDALRSTDPDEVDMEHKECEWKMTWDDDAWDQAREFELFDPEYPVEELEAQKETDANQRLPAPVQTNTTQSVALVKTSAVLPRRYSLSTERCSRVLLKTLFTVVSVPEIISRLMRLHKA